MTEGSIESFDPKTLKLALEDEIDARSAKYLSERESPAHQKGDRLSIAPYINSQEIEKMIEGIIDRLGGGPREQGMVFVSVKDNSGCSVSSDSDCDAIVVSVAYGHELILNNREYPSKENRAEEMESELVFNQDDLQEVETEMIQHNAMAETPMPEPVVCPDDEAPGIAAIQADDTNPMELQLTKELKRKIDELWTNRIGLGVDFNNPRALKIELVQDSPRITKIVQEIGEEILDVSIDRENGVIYVTNGGNVCLKWEIPTT